MSGIPVYFMYLIHNVYRIKTKSRKCNCKEAKRRAKGIHEIRIGYNTLKDRKMLLKTALKTHRKNHGLTQKELAKKLHLRQYTISDYETGRIEPSLPILIRYADYFRISLDELVFHEPKKPKESKHEDKEKDMNENSPSVQK